MERPRFAAERDGKGLRLALSGAWIAATGDQAETQAQKLKRKAAGTVRATLDLRQVERLDTAGAWIIDRTRHELESSGTHAAFEGARAEHQTLLTEARYRVFEAPQRARGHWTLEFLVDVGRAVAGTGHDLNRGISFLGEVVSKIMRQAIDPRRWRPASVVTQLESFAWRSVPIIALINFLVGCIVAQQGLYQFKRFGASTYAVNLIGLLGLRELGVLLTAIMIAGRTGSSITAEIGSMKMREEIDAMRVMGLDPIEVLIIPRILALVIALPLLTFIADIAVVFGGLLTSRIYAGISPTIFLNRFQNAITADTFFSGLTKAPFMALVIGCIASVEGLAVQGSAESLGRQVTASVVKSIFMVIFVDGVFALFFAAIDF